MSRWELRIEEPDQQPVRVIVRAGMRIGRNPQNDVVLTDAKTSGFHAQFQEHEGVLHVVDLGSTNKTRIEAGPVLSEGHRFPLEHGRRIFMGRAVLICRDREFFPFVPGDEDSQDARFAEKSTLMAAPVDAAPTPPTPEPSKQPPESRPPSKPEALAGSAPAPPKKADKAPPPAKVEEAPAKVETPKAAEPKAVEAKPEDPKVVEAEPVEPKAELKPEPKAAEPKAAEVKPEEPKAVEAEPVAPKAELKPEPKADEPKAAEAKPAEPEVESKPEPKPVEPKVESKPEPKPVEPKVESKPEPKPVEPKVESKPEPKPAEPEVESKPEPKPVEPKVESKPEPKLVEPKVESKPEPKAVEPKAESKPAEPKRSGTRIKPPDPEPDPSEAKARRATPKPKGGKKGDPAPPDDASADEESSESLTVFGGDVGGILRRDALADVAGFRVARPRLVVASEAIRDRYVLSEASCVVGRSGKKASGVHCRLQHDAVSSVHAEISYRQGRFFIEDQGSRNGTFLGHELLTANQARELKPDTHIRFGTVDALWVTDVDGVGNKVPEGRYRDALEILASDGAVTRLSLRKVTDEAKEKGMHAGEVLLLEGRITVAQWCDALVRAPFLQVMRGASSRGGNRTLWVVLLLLLIVGVIIVLLLRPGLFGLGGG